MLPKGQLVQIQLIVLETASLPFGEDAAHELSCAFRSELLVLTVGARMPFTQVAGWILRARWRLAPPGPPAQPEHLTSTACSRDIHLSGREFTAQGLRRCWRATTAGNAVRPAIQQLSYQSSIIRTPLSGWARLLCAQYRHRL